MTGEFPDEGSGFGRSPRTTLGAEELEELGVLDEEECEVLAGLMAQGPSEVLVPGAVSAEQRDRVLGELDELVASVPAGAREQVAVFAQAYGEVLEELAALEGAFGGVEEVDVEALGRIDELMRAPEVVEATAAIEGWIASC